MPNVDFQRRNRALLSSLTDSRQLKEFYYLQGALGPTAQIESIGEVIVLCSNNYLGLANHPEVIAAGIEGLNTYGAGTSSVRFICGSLACHQHIGHCRPGKRILKYNGSNYTTGTEKD